MPMRRTLIGVVLLAAVAGPTPASAQRHSFDCSAVRDYPSCAQGVGALAGRIIGTALSCDVPEERWTPVAEVMAAVVANVAVDEEDRLEGMRLMNVLGQEALRRRASGADQEPCEGFVRYFGDLARRLGVE